MEQTGFKIYGYRWVMLLAFMFAVAVNQLLWITFASITGDAVKYYGVSDLSIGLLSLVFMVVYIVVSIPASWAIDTYGVRVAVGIGAALTGIFGLMRGVFAPDYNLVLIAQIGIAIGQPFILNAVTTVAARWFPVQERATAAGLGSLATYLGILVGVALTPYLAVQSGIGGVLMAYGIVSVIAAVVFFVMARERPPTPPCPPDQEARSLVLDGLKQTLQSRGFILLMLIFFVGLGVFNAVTTWIEDIVRPRGFTITQAGDAGGLMIIGGIIGALLTGVLNVNEISGVDGSLLTQFYGVMTTLLYSGIVSFILLKLIDVTIGLRNIWHLFFLARFYAKISSIYFYGLQRKTRYIRVNKEIHSPAEAGLFLTQATASQTAFRASTRPRQCE